MSRSLPLDLVHLVCNYLPIHQIPPCITNPHFWRQRIAGKLLLDVDQIVKATDHVQIAAYYNIVLPGAERYLCPVQCYLASLHKPTAERQHYLNLCLPYISDVDDEIVKTLKYKCLTNHDLVNDIIFILTNCKLTFMDKLFACAMAVAGSDQLIILQNNEYFKINAEKINIITNIIKNGNNTNEYRYHYYRNKYAIIFGREEDIVLSHIYGIVEGCLISGQPEKVLKYANHLTHGVTSDFGTEYRHHIHSLELYLQLRELFREPDDHLTYSEYRYLRYGNSIIYDNNRYRISPVFEYVANKPEIYLKDQFSTETILLGKTIHDFYGFRYIWEKIGRQSLAIGEVKSNECKLLLTSK